ncbi:polysaccharide pyruvyl transferase family protein [Rothia uropygialis]|uniref:polysaccharide pyruvyl transferase family protein n=1 Tax=Kocuria sp. 36 TaxID=1415402 RepID=UPI00101E0511|nr:polysaccharide pyruvyl transferase family protein [Kocuria sp. 36]
MHWFSHRSAVEQPPNDAGSIYLLSTAGIPNFGDELIAARWVSYLASVAPDTDVWLDVREPGTVASLLKGLHPRLHLTNTAIRAADDSLNGSRRTVTDLVQNLGSPRYDIGLLEMREASVLHLLGGGFVNRMWPHNELVVEAMRAAAEVSGAKLVATGQGLMPAGTEGFEGFDHVSVRDRPSADLLGIRRGYDDAYLIPEVPGRNTDGETEVVLCIQSDLLDPGGFERFVDFARAQIRLWDVPAERVTYVEAIPGGDYAAYAVLNETVGVGRFVPFTQFWREEFPFAAHQVWITTRFHHHLLGSLAGARGIVLTGKTGYYDVKHSSLSELGTGWVLSSGATEELLPMDQLRRPGDFRAPVEAKNAEADGIYERH